MTSHCQGSNWWIFKQAQAYYLARIKAEPWLASSTAVARHVESKLMRNVTRRQRRKPHKSFNNVLFMIHSERLITKAYWNNVRLSWLSHVIRSLWLVKIDNESLSYKDYSTSEGSASFYDSRYPTWLCKAHTFWPLN